jgi:hypothetical protein
MNEQEFHTAMQQLIAEKAKEDSQIGRTIRHLQAQEHQERQAKRRAREDRFLKRCRADIEKDRLRTERLLRGENPYRSQAQKSALARKNAAASVAARRKENQGWIHHVLQQAEMKRIRQFREDTPEVLGPWQQAGGKARARTRTYRAGEGGCFPRKPGSRRPAVAVLN